MILIVSALVYKKEKMVCDPTNFKLMCSSKRSLKYFMILKVNSNTVAWDFLNLKKIKLKLIMLLVHLV